MASRMRWGSPSAFAEAAGGLALVGVLAALDDRRLDLAFGLLFGAFLLYASAIVLVRAWRTGGDPDQLRGVFRGGQFAALPPACRRWVARWILGFRGR